MSTETTYHRLGDYIREVNVRNTDLAVTKLLGLSMTKEFRPSTSNMVGVDLSKYKIVNKNVFAFDTMSVIRVHKVPIAINTTEEPKIVSPAYVTFESIDTKILDPLYLMMWFRRSEFDRYADFKSDAAVRGGYDWSELCDTYIGIPSIAQQQKIVAEYETLSHRIRLNEQLISKLEETAQALYRKMFVDGIDKENLPEGWKMGTLGDFGDIITGKTPSCDHPEDFGENMPFVTPGDFQCYKKLANGALRNLSIIGAKRLSNKILPIGSVIVTCIGSDMGKVAISAEQCITNQQMNSVVVAEKYYSDYLYYFLLSISTELKSMALGSSTMPMLNKSDFERIILVNPSCESLQKFAKLLEVINMQILSSYKETKLINQLQSLLLARMGRKDN